jgi:molecular chaperone DnaK (HSP70)
MGKVIGIDLGTTNSCVVQLYIYRNQLAIHHSR